MMKTGFLALSLAVPLMAQADVAIDPADAALDAALAQAESCPMALIDLTASAVSQMDVSVLAPCYGGQSVVLDHAGLVMTGTLSANGALYVSLPMLQADAPVTVTFADGMMAEAVLSAPEVSNVQDVAARW